jgi:hypothetical protein
MYIVRRLLGYVKQIQNATVQCVYSNEIKIECLAFSVADVCMYGRKEENGGRFIGVMMW